MLREGCRSSTTAVYVQPLDIQGKHRMFYTQYPNKPTGCVCRKLRGYGGRRAGRNHRRKGSGRKASIS
jgi:hypothetical protein